MYVTVYTKQVKRRKSGRTETLGCAYSTKSLTQLHADIRERHADAQTWLDPQRVIIDFVAGMNLGVRPIVVGGQLVAGAQS